MTAIADLLLPLNPGIILILGGAIAATLPAPVGRWFVVGLPIVLLSYLFGVELGNHGGVSFLDYQLETFRLDGLSRVFGTIFLIGAFLCNLYAMGDNVDRTQRTAAQIYGGSAIAAVFAGDMITLFIFFELAAVSSVFLIWARGTERAYAAGMRYLVVQVAAGVILLAGVLHHVAITGSVAFNSLGLEAPGGTLIFIAFGIKCAFPLFHNWLQDAYPEATISGTVILSGFTTKLAVYALARSYAGTEILIWIGATMTAFPIFYAVIENDLRRVLAYSLNNQLGFMVVGIGIGTEMALNGTISHAFSHILYKALLFMSMGAVLLRAGTCNGSDLGGLFRTMPWSTGFCIVGAASISGFPLFSGFISKSMILTAVAAEGYWGVWLVLLFASAGVFHHSGIKIPYFAFFAHDSGLRPKEAPWPMLAAMGITAALCIGIGVYPDPLYAMLPFAVDYVPYTTYHVVNQLQLLMFSALAFTVLMLTRIYPPELHSTNLDIDWLYRRVGKQTMLWLGRCIDSFYTLVTGGLIAMVAEVIEGSKRHFGSGGLFSRTPEVGNGVVWIVAMLFIVLMAAFSNV